MKKWFKKYRVRIRNIILGIVIIGLLTIIFLVIYGYLNNSTKPFFPSDRAELGQFGDYFGGTLNPIFGFASFTALLATIIYQAKELKLSRTELELTRKELANSATALANQNKAIELQSFEQTFFSWLNTYKDLLYSIKGKVVSMNSIAGNQQEGREFIYDLWDQYLSMTKLASLFFKQNEYDQLTNQVYEHLNLETKNIDEVRGWSYDKKLDFLCIENSSFITKFIQTQWLNLYSNNEYKLDSFFRTAYKLITWIDSQHAERLNNAQKWLYVSIIRSQLSWIEMIYLYYNGLTDRGFKFKLLIEKYALFDNLTIESDNGIKILNIYLPDESVYKPEAFSSESARKKLGLPKSSEETLALATTGTE